MERNRCCVQKINLVLIGLFLLISSISEAANLTGLSFRKNGDTSEIIVQADSAIAPQESVRLEGKQIILDLHGVNVPKKLSRPLDTSEFPGNLVLVTPLQAGENLTRIVLQLREKTNYKIVPATNGFSIELENIFGAFTKSSPPASLSQTNAPIVNENPPKQEKTIRIDSGPAQIVDVLDGLGQSGEKKYIGQKITLNLSNASVDQALKFISRVSGFNIVFSQAAAQSPPITLFLEDVPWDQALDMILELNNLVASRSNNILNIKTFPELAAQKKLEREAKKEVTDLQPLVTRIHKISYASAAQIVSILNPYLTKDKGTIQVDTRTDSLIVVDTAEVQDKIKKVIEILDTQTPQILVEAKIVEAKEDFTRTIGLDKGFNLQIRTNGTSSESSSGLLSVSPIAGSVGFEATNLRIRGLGLVEQLSANLTIQETEGKVDIISSPRLVTQNNQSATIVAQDKKVIPTSVTNDRGETVNENVTLDLPTTLTVTPKTTGEGSIDMTLNIQRTSTVTAEAGTVPDTETRSIQTRVLIANGGTVVLGGMYQNDYTEASITGVPILRHLPLIGMLFRTPHSVSQSKRELLVFITPRILNLEEAGFAVQKERTIELPNLSDIEPIENKEVLKKPTETTTQEGSVSKGQTSSPSLSPGDSQDLNSLENLDELENLENL